jgi:hypothetical protein
MHCAERTELPPCDHSEDIEQQDIGQLVYLALGATWVRDLAEYLWLPKISSHLTPMLEWTTLAQDDRLLEAGSEPTTLPPTSPPSGTWLTT